MTELPKRILAIGAHPDDIEMSCAGTLAKFLTRGSAVHLAVVCKGDKGGGAETADDLAARRAREAQAAAALLGAPIEFLGLPDAEVTDDSSTRRLFVDLLRTIRPELVLTHDPQDYHADHLAVNQLVMKASWFAASPGHITDDPPLPQTPAVLFMDTLTGIGFQPTHLVDVTETFELKRRMILCHGSQTSRADSGMDRLLEIAETLGRLRGLQCGVGYAEGFRPYLAFGRRRCEPLLP